MIARRRYNLVLAVYPNTRGYAFALFEGALAPVDWGVREARGADKNNRCLRRIAGMFDRYAPDMLVLQDMSEAGTRRACRIRRLNGAIGELAAARGLCTVAYSRDQVRACFARLATPTKDGIAGAIARHIPAFERDLPPRRRPWMTEHLYMGLFDAAALAWAFFETEGGNHEQAA